MKLILLCAVVILSLVRAEYPGNLPKCKRLDSACTKKAIIEYLQKHNTGLKEVNLPSFDPLHVKSIILERNPTSPVNVEIKLKDLSIMGMKDMQVKSFEGLGDFGKRVQLEATVPDLKLNGQYAIDGSILILPIVGSGPIEVAVKNINFKYSYDLKPVEKNGHIYANLEHVKLEMKPEHVFYHFENLFNGDKALNDNMNKFLNDNWAEVYSEMSPIISKAISLVIKSMINKFFESNPFDDYFV